MLNSCSLIKYAEGVQGDAINERLKKKNYVFQAEFQGNVIKKHKIGFGESRFKVLVAIEEPIDKNLIKGCYYYYLSKQELDSVNVFEFSVSKEIFKDVLLNSSFTKSKDSYDVSIDQSKYLLISKEEHDWIP